MTVTEYLGGGALLSFTVAAVVAAALLVLRRRLAHLVGAARLVAMGLLFTALLIAVHLIPAALGVLTRGSVIVIAFALVAITSRLPQAQPAGPVSAPEPLAPSGRASWVLAGLGGTAVVVGLLAYLHRYLAFSPIGIDALNFHLPGVFRWIQDGSIWQVDQFVPDQAHGNYPHNGDVVLLAGVLPWRDDFLLRVVFLPWAALTGIATYALARELRAPRAAAILAGALVIALPNVLFDLVESTLPDAVMFSTFAAGMAFLARHHRTRASSDLVLAGLGLGLAFGTKWFGVSSVIALLVVWTVVSLLERRGPRRVALDGGILVGMISLAGGIWLVRNLVLSGNPVFPVKVSLFGVTIFDAPRDIVRELGGFSISEYAGQPDIWREYFIPAWWRSLGLAALLLPVGTLVAVALAWGRQRRQQTARPHSRRVVVAAVAVAVLFAVYTITPYTAFGAKGDPAWTFVNVRYALPAVLLAAALTAVAAGHMGRWGRAIELAMLAAVVDGLRRSADFGVGNAVRAVGVVAAVTAAVLGVSRLARARPRLAAPSAALAIGCAVLAVGAWGYRQQDRLHHAGYRGMDPAIDYVIENASGDRHIGLAGSWDSEGPSPVAPMFGPELENEVTYIGPFIREMLREYRSRDGFDAALARGGYDLVVVGRAPPPQPGASHDPVRYDRWLRAAGWEQVTTSRRLMLYRPASSATAGEPSLGPEDEGRQR